MIFLACRTILHKSYLINANLPKSSKRILAIFKLLYHFLFNYFDQIYTVSNEMKNRIKKFLKEDAKVKVLGDTRFDQIQYRKNNISSHITLPKKFETLKNILFGSIESSSAAEPPVKEGASGCSVKSS